MFPEESPNRPETVRQSYPPRRASVDGLSLTRPNYARRGVPPRAPVAIQTPQPQIAEPISQPESIVEIPAPEDFIAPPAQPLDFTPPVLQKKPKTRVIKLPRFSKPRLHISKPVIGFVLAAGIASTALGLAYSQTNKSSSDTLLRQALELQLSTRTVHTDTSNGSRVSSADYDFSNATNPVVSTLETVQLGGAVAQLKGYGDTKNNFVSYSKLPSGIDPSQSSALIGSWVQLRSNGALAAGVPAQLSHAGDPRYVAFGPVPTGNPSAAVRGQILNYLLEHRAYDYSAAKPAKDSVKGQKTMRYDAQANVSYLKIANQSLAAANGLSPADIQDAVAALDSLKGATLHLFINTKSHRIVRFGVTKNNVTVATDYSGFNDATVAAEPQTKLTWTQFAATQYKLASSVAAKQSPLSLDNLRKNQINTLQTAFKNYYIQTASYPSLSNVNDPAWVAANLIGLDADALRDPSAASPAILAAPKAANIAYQPVPRTGTACNNTAENPCVHYKLIATLSTTQQYSVTDP